jgi:hypothetical protein
MAAQAPSDDQSHVRASALGDQDPEPWEQAITELRSDGLLRLNGDVIEPTLTAIRANELLDVTI